MKNLVLFSLVLAFFSNCTNKSAHDHIYVPYHIDSTIVSVVQDTILLTSKEEKTIIASPKDYDQIAEIVPPSWKVVENHEGKEIAYDDFNKDGFKDVAMLVEFRGDTTYEYSEEVMLIVAIADKNGQLETASISGNLGGESVGYKNQQHLWSKNGILSYLHQSMRHHVEVKYHFDTIAFKFVLIGKEFSDYGGMASPPRSISINYLIGKKIIKEQIWDLETEELVPLEDKIERFDAFQLPLAMLDWENIYGQLEGD